MNESFNTIDEYIDSFPVEVKALLQQIRVAIRQVAKDAVESISYGMPAYKLNGKPLIYFAAFKNHIGFYALPAGHLAFAEELSKYKRGKGSVQFPIDKPLPLELIMRMVEFSVNENVLISSKSRKG